MKYDNELGLCRRKVQSIQKQNLCSFADKIVSLKRLRLDFYLNSRENFITGERSFSR